MMKLITLSMYKCAVVQNNAQQLERESEETPRLRNATGESCVNCILQIQRADCGPLKRYDVASRTHEKLSIIPCNWHRLVSVWPIEFRIALQVVVQRMHTFPIDVCALKHNEAASTAPQLVQDKATDLIRIGHLLVEEL